MKVETFSTDNFFATSDPHFYHNNIIKFQATRHKYMSEKELKLFNYINSLKKETSEWRYESKNFKISNESVERMNQDIIDKWNSVVPPEGRVVCLGDFAWRDTRKIREQLNGSIYLIEGNHDKDALRNSSCFEWIRSLAEIVVEDIHGNVRDIVCCHYPMRSWNRSHRGSFHIYGHEHGNLEHTPWGRSLDVGFDCFSKPLDYYQLEDLLIDRPYTRHHE